MFLIVNKKAAIAIVQSNLEETLRIWTTRTKRGNVAAGYVCAFLIPSRSRLMFKVMGAPSETSNIPDINCSAI